MAHHVTGLAGLEGAFRQARLACVVVAVVAVRLAPGTGVEYPEGIACGDQHVAAVAGRVQAVEAVELRPSHRLQGPGVEDRDAAVMGEDEARRGALGFLGCRARRVTAWRRGSRAARRGGCAAAGEEKCGKCHGGQRERAAGGTFGRGVSDHALNNNDSH